MIEVGFSNAFVQFGNEAFAGEPVAIFGNCFVEPGSIARSRCRSDRRQIIERRMDHSASKRFHQTGANILPAIAVFTRIEWRHYQRISKLRESLVAMKKLHDDLQVLFVSLLTCFGFLDRSQSARDGFFINLEFRSKALRVLGLERIFNALIKHDALSDVDNILFVTAPQLLLLLCLFNLLRLIANLLELRLDLFERDKAQPAFTRVQQGAQFQILNAKDLSLVCFLRLRHRFKRPFDRRHRIFALVDPHHRFAADHQQGIARHRIHRLNAAI